MGTALDETSAWKRTQEVRDLLGASWGLARKVSSILVGVISNHRHRYTHAHI